MARSRHLLHPELLDLLKTKPTNDLSQAGLEQIRSASRKLVEAEKAFRQLYPVESDVSVSEQFTAGSEPDAHPVRMLVYTPPPAAGAGRLPCYLSIHGGGYVLGNPDQHDHQHRALSREQSCVVVAPAYRLAPEHPYPAGLNDCLAALRWVLDHADALGIDPARIVVGGESAGGGLAAAIALAIREAGDIRLAGQVLVYPMLDDRTGATADGGAFTGEYLWTRNSNRFAWRCYLGAEPGGDPVGHAAPARAGDLSALPPCHIFVGSLDLFRDESIAYANRLMEAGVPASLHVYAGACHAFDLAPLASLTRRFQAEFNEALADLFGRPDERKNAP
ncbi:alpha/beta hydrolase [Niveispirillum sp.]|uniref:alpha/beta hydrolase n=1 Tax=Niveispirillum sp. TaxID=1917217 RepID=UPI001B58FB8B|nr:alpha/beta hydrolase [Niveispirillum sp.]MBP7336557.1 alpha/beta hydrolase [Niveispirillum sp.]